MAACLKKLNTKLINNINNLIRHGHWLRGKAPGVAKSLEEKFAELNYKDPNVYYRVDIGYPKLRQSRSVELTKRLEYLKSNRNSNLETQAREKQLLINLEEAKKDWLDTCGPYQIKTIADHYGIYEHLFGDAYFIPRKPLDIFYSNHENSFPVYYGNIIKPEEASKQPTVNFNSEDNSCLWTLIMTNPDGHFTEKNSEYVHWFIGNIPGNDITKGDVIVDYLQPFPPKGTGYHRHIFILYKQNKLMDYSCFKKSSSLNLADRTFSTFNFYRDRQDDITPIGLAFFQSDWDKTLTDFFHNTLNMKEPVFEYDFPPPYIKPQTWFPLKQPFNLYLDKYKDPKEVSERYFKEKLKEVNPFEAPKPKFAFPNAEPFPKNVPSWLRLEIKKKRLGWGRVNDV